MREDNVRKIWSDAELDAALADLHDDVDEDDSLAFARASLMAAAGTTEAPPRQRRRGSWRWIAVAAAVVTLVGGLGIVVSLRPPAPEPAQPAAQLADLDRPLAPGEFHYTQKLAWVTQMTFGRPSKFQQMVELWIPADPTGVWHRRTRWTGGITGLDPTSQAKVHLDRAPLDEYGPGGVFPSQPPVNWVAPDASFVASLPPDRAQVAKALLRDNRGGPAESLTMVRSVLALGLVRKDVRFALRDALIAIPSVHAEPAHTADGRPATVIVAKDTGQRLYLDPSTAQLLAAADGVFSVTEHSGNVPRSTSPPPPSSAGFPSTTVTTTTEIPLFPPNPQKFGEPDAVYSYAITRTSG
ncbi:CU044_5270 family protein [Amycolatopsis sp. MEPSY49]|uniref:CU044_5270 family protein n=1 Tax=Amycolatopsis sp. MEPSY49 TaxID=3151600 RepID=UPI003EF54289